MSDMDTTTEESTMTNATPGGGAAAEAAAAAEAGFNLKLPANPPSTTAAAAVSRTPSMLGVDELEAYDDAQYLGQKNMEMQAAIASKIKQFESETDSHLDKNFPVLARLDGVSFHTFTKGMSSPYDRRFVWAMQQTALDLVEKMGAASVYVMSDEISLLFPPLEPQQTPPYNYRTQKMASTLAGFTSARFNVHIAEAYRKFPDPPVAPQVLERMQSGTAYFDGRVFAAKDAASAADAILWRQRYDGPKNSIGTVARKTFGAKELHSVGCFKMLQMLKEAGKPFSKEDPGYRFGTLMKKATVYKEAIDRKTNKPVRVMRTIPCMKSAPILGSNEEASVLLLGRRLLPEQAEGGGWFCRDGSPLQEVVLDENVAAEE